MDTKRCARCHKLLRKEAEICSRCGYSYVKNPTRSATSSMPPGKRRRARTSTFAGNRRKGTLVAAQRRSIPPASPHRAGHYSGLHPEDQPYQSTIMVVQPAPEQSHSPQQEQPALVSKHLPVVAERPFQPAMHPEDMVTLPSHQFWPPFYRDRPQRDILRVRFVPTTLTIACLIFLIASSLLAYIFINRKPIPGRQILSVMPSQLRVNDTFTLEGQGFGTHDLISFTHDKHNDPLLDGNGRALQTHADDLGTFSVQVVVPSTWQVGQHAIYAFDIGKEQSISVVAMLTVQQSSSAPPLLQLPTSSIDLGANLPGVVAKKEITLVNAGGQQLSWQASSDQAWLTVTPNSGTFSGSTIVTITANSGQLAPQSYAGHVTFIQQGSSNQPLTLMATMTVKSAPPASLLVSPVALNFSSVGQNPASQVIAIQNSGGVAVAWTATTATVDGANWLTITPASGSLASGQATNATVSVNVANLKPRSYQGSLTFSYGGATNQVAVSLTVSVPPAAAISLNLHALNFTTIKGHNPAPQSFTITNTGNATLNWSISEDQNGASFAPVSSTMGSLAPSRSTIITVFPNLAQAGAGTLTATLTVVDSDGGTKVTSQKLSVNIVIKDQAMITLSVNMMSFSHDSVITESSQLLDIKNTGSQPLNWLAQPSNPWLTAVVPSGSLAPGKDILIDVHCQSSGFSPGTYTSSLIIRDSDNGTPVFSQQVVVTMVVS